jgi:tetratricopeptide (TPR) repeat protein
MTPAEAPKQAVPEAAPATPTIDTAIVVQEPAPTPASPELPKPAPAKPSAESLAARRAAAAKLYAEGRQLIETGRLPEAIGALTDAIALDPSLSRAFNSRGYARLLSKSYTLAVSDFTEAIRLNPLYGNAYHNRAIARRHSGDQVGAGEDEAEAARLSKIGK